MKYSLHILFFLLPILLSAQRDDQVLMTIGNTPVTVGEFRYIYEKNNSENADYSEASLREYLDLYKKFKLKVKKAQVQGLDKEKTIAQELKGYKDQLTKSFLDKKIMDDLVQEIFDRKKEEVKVSHIFVRDEDNARQALARLKNKRFEDVVKEYSEDEYTKNDGGNLGYISAMLQDGFYYLENAIYSTPKGQTSGIVPSIMGFHIIKVTDRRLKKDRIKVAQILIHKQKNPAKGQPTAKELIRQAYAEWKDGMSWNDLVKTYSTDNDSKQKNGELPILVSGTLEKNFEDAAYGLADGQVSKPVETSIGYHIIKKIATVKAPSFEELKKKKYRELKRRDRYRTKYSQLSEGNIEEYLSQNNKGYENLIREYSEGILLFEIMKRKVWEKASNDIEGQKKYYKKHKNKYKNKTFEKVKGLVIADYQDSLEKEWVKSLEKEFKVITNKKVLKSLIK